jgi:predicted nuclease of predicted toxin-antitoxin system
MKLLIDQNLSPRLVDRLLDLFPDSGHVSPLGLDRASDEEVWSYAHANRDIIVTKDADFSELGLLRGFPPKVIWIRSGNSTTDQIEALIRLHLEDIQRMSQSAGIGILALL